MTVEEFEDWLRREEEYERALELAARVLQWVRSQIGQEIVEP
ncbi:MAG: hypothetical protein ACE5I2_10705 [Anaerolineae bacterium]